MYREIAHHDDRARPADDPTPRDDDRAVPADVPTPRDDDPAPRDGPSPLPEYDPALRDRVTRLVGVLRRAALARTRPVRHTRGYSAELRLVEIADQAAVRRPTVTAPEILRVGRDEAHAATFDALFDLHRLGADAPETVELVLAGGMLHAPGDPDVHVHLLTQAVRIDRDRETGEMVAAITEDAVTVEDEELLGGTPLLDLREVAAEHDRLTTRLASPLDPALCDVLGEWARRCLRVPHAVGDDWIAPAEDDPVTRVVPAPTLVARRRGAVALRTFYDRIADELADPALPLPVGLAQLVAAVEPADRTAWLGRTGHDVPPVSDPLFPLPVGRAQGRILRRLGRDSGVVVEGPPGTGKTHTIANLLCALLAEGRRVLVTSEKAQALRVLRDMLPPGMRGLCVSLADPGAAGDPELAAGVAGLASAATEFDPVETDRRIDELTELRDALVAEREQVLDAIVAARGAETVRHREIAPGFAGTRAEIARRVVDTRARDGWLAALVDTSRVLPRDPPCSATELAELRALRTGDPPVGSGRAGQYFPPPVELPPESHVADLAALVTRGEAATTGERGRLTAALGALPPAAAQHLPSVCRRIADAIVELEDTGEDLEWARGVADAVLAGRAAHLWSRAVEQLAAVDDLLDHDRLAGAAQVRVADSVDPIAAAPAFERFAAWLEEGNAPKRLFKDATQKGVEPHLVGIVVHGGDVGTAPGAHAVAHHLRILEITGRLSEAFAPLSYPLRRAEYRSLLVEQARALRATCLQVGAVLTAAGQLRAVLAALPAARRPRVDSLGVLEIASTLTLGVDEVRAAELARSELGEIVERVEGGVAPERRAPEVGQVVEALRQRDPDGYVDALAAIDTARAEQRDERRADQLARRLRDTVPGLLAALDEPAGWAARAAHWPEAWAHARAVAWLRSPEEACPGADPERLPEIDGRPRTRSLSDLDTEVAAVTADLATARAWRACLGRTTAEQARALQSHRASTAAIGRGTGRYAEHYRRAARAAVDAARDAVPAWVMPIREVLGVLEPRRDTFDVVVVDEASQADLTSLFLLWLAPRVIVVGDDRQCTPAEVGVGSLEPAFARLETDLPDVPAYLRHQFTPRSSVFSVFRTTFGPPVRLREHFRSMPEIISWSSREFYAGDGAEGSSTIGAAGAAEGPGNREPLVPLRRFGTDRLPPLRSTFVPDTANRGSGSALANPAEAGALVDAVVACAADPAYAGATFGVVVLQGHGQVELIDAMLRERLDPAQWEARRLRVGVPADFQGDERTVVWLSMVVAPGHRLVALSADRFRQGFNVAASRARDQMWLFHSVNRDALAPADLRRRLLDHVTVQGADPADSAGTLAHPVSTEHRDPAFTSLFSQRVHAELTERGYAVVPRLEVNGRRLDLVVTGASGRLAVICDGADRRGPVTRADVEREQDLRRCGWPVVRIRESDHLVDPDGVLADVVAALEAAGVAPTSHLGRSAVRDVAPSPLPDGTRPAYAPSEGATDSLDRLVADLAAAGLPPPRRDAQVHDGGALLCDAAALWPTGISRRALAAPVVLTEDPDRGVHERLRALGYVVFTSVADLRAHVTTNAVP